MLVYRGIRLSEKNARRRRAKIFILVRTLMFTRLKYRLIGLQAGGNTSMHITAVFNESKAMLHVSSEIKEVALNHPKQTRLFVTF